MREKDRLWGRYKELKNYIGERMCTKSEMWKPTDYNVNKHIQERKLTQKSAEELKKIGKELGESTNIEGFRPKR